jgi:hypothetical protein
MKLLMDEKDINLPSPGEEILAKNVTYLLVCSRCGINKGLIERRSTIDH